MKNIRMSQSGQSQTAATKIVSQAGAVSLVQTAPLHGSGRGLSQALKPVA